MRDLILERGPEIRRQILFGLVIAAPVVFLRVVNDPFNVPKLGLLMIVLPIVAAIRAAEIIQGAPWRSLLRLWVPAAALLTPLVMSWMFSSYRGYSTFGLYPRFQGLVPYIVVTFFGVLLADAFSGRLEDLARAFLWSGAIVGSYAVIQFLGLDPFQWNLFGATGQVISTIGNSNFVGGFLGIVLPVGLGYALSDPDHRARWLRILAPVVVGWLVARSQGGYLAGAAGVAVVVGFALSRVRSHFRILAFAAVGGLVAIGIVSVVLAVAYPDSRFGLSGAQLRGRWWVAAFRMFLEAPIVGRGPNTFAIEGVSERVLEDAVLFGYDFPDDPHSVFFSFLANTGVLGALGYLFMLGWAIRESFAVHRDDVLRVGFAAATAAYFVQSFFSIDEPVLRIGLFVALAGLVTQGAQAKTTTKTGSRKKQVARKKKKPVGLARDFSSVRKPWAVILVAFASLFVVILGVRFVVADARVLNAQSLFAQGQTARGAAEMEKALAFRSDSYYKSSYAFALKDLALTAGADAEPLFERSSDLFHDYLSETPFVFGFVNHAELLDDWGEKRRLDDDVAAIARYEEARAIDPRNPFIAIEQAAVMVEIERYAEALELLEPVAQNADADSRYADFWGLLAVSRAATGDEAGAREALEIARVLTPEDPEVLEAEEILRNG